ncbi:pyridoxamine 5'-phosphate oxidase family protein [Salsuginibacillus kocurii]|uniref:pyridoxamine 5'-phosphate oxidase family protein n=1 Tax=Salsuginibacillus kocurii TaxID=427078 RepID=UPI00036B32AB|nr:pyridoxamine 5'-phosphate oxidase family protein [Salsuginibacillus kocurii]
MDQDTLKEEILNIMNEHKHGTLATVKKNRPHSRYMTYFNEGFTLFTPTDKETHKTEEIEENPNVHILLGYEGGGIGDQYVEVEGKAEIREDADTKKGIWQEDFANWFDGPEDPDYIILEITPVRIRLMNTGEGPHSIEF